MKNKIKPYLLFGLVCIMAFLVSCESEKEFSHNPSVPMTIDSFLPAQGGGGTEILINGSNFSTDTTQVAVTLNGKRLKIVGTNGKQLMVVVPKKVGSGKIEVKIGTQSIQSSENFTYKFTRTVSTLAGTGQAGFQNGEGANAMFNFNGQSWMRSMGIAVDDNSNVYVADPGNHCIRKIDSAGNVTTFAGNPYISGFSDGKGTSALFSIPYDVALDAEGNVYSVDPGNWDIRKISPDGTATTLTYGNQAPWSVAVDKKTGYVYYTSCSSPGNVYPVTSQGSTLDPIVTGLNYPAGIKFDNNGNLYASINGDQVIKKFTAGTWEGSVIAGTQGTAGYLNGVGTEAKFSYPWGLAVDEKGNIYVAGNGTWDGGTYNADQSIRYIEADTWNVSTFAGSNIAGFADAVGEAAAFSAPNGVAVDKNGTVYVLDKNNNKIRKIVSE
ncbi:MAG: IPT/TIG domain-containing protein [Bacteroidota bacterium]|nr:IPT/TIG domain-containing protein [Bacteroidota bacterium]